MAGIDPEGGRQLVEDRGTKRRDRGLKGTETQTGGLRPKGERQIPEKRV